MACCTACATSLSAISAQIGSKPGSMTSWVLIHERRRVPAAPMGAPKERSQTTSRAAAAPPDPGLATRSPDGPRRRSEHAAPGDRRILEGTSARTRPGALGRLAFETSMTIIRERVGSHADAQVVRVQSGIHRDQEEGSRVRGPPWVTASVPA